jgi:hypothetical protein
MCGCGKKIRKVDGLYKRPIVNRLARPSNGRKNKTKIKKLFI